MKIRMYNVGCGDCFCIRDRGKSLLVDFGTCNSRINGQPRSEIFDVIISDLTTISHKNLLLTHFHLDHLSGLLYMIKKRISAYEFGKIYLPDVFSEPEMSHILALLLLSDLMKNTYLPSKQVSLFALVEALCRKPQRIELLSRGKEFEGKYQALWPDKEMIRAEAEETYEKIMRDHEEAMTVLTDFAECLRQLVWSMTGEEKKHPPFAVIDRAFKELRSRGDFQQLLSALEGERMNLRQFKNKISIVFQNARDGELNLLFTGDVQQGHLKQIAENYDGKYPLHDHYWCIKVPHHGSQTHFFDFAPYTPENMLISNGIYYADRKKQAGAYRTSAQYAGLFYINDAHMYCSDCRCCDGYRNGCTCKECDIIEPLYYKDI